MDKLNKIELGNRITKLRESKHKTQSDIANLLELKSHQQVSYLENGNENRNMSLSQLITLAEYFNVSTDYLLGLSDAPTSDKDLQFICDYTGLNENTIQFFNASKTDTDYYKNTVAFIEVLVDKLSYDIEYNLTLTDLKECTNYLSLISSFDDKCSIKDIDSQIEKYKDIDESINGKKYKLNQLFNDVLDEYSISDIGLNSIAELRFQIHNLFKKQKELLDTLAIETYADIYKEEMSKDTLNAINETEKAGEDNEKE